MNPEHECHPAHLTYGYDSGGAALCRRCGWFFKKHFRDEPWRPCNVKYHGVPKDVQIDDTVYFEVPGRVIMKSIVPGIGFYTITSEVIGKTWDGYY